jgi:hypothetical protein
MRNNNYGLLALRNYIVTNMIIARLQFGKHRLKAGIVKSERTFIAEQRLGNHFPAGKDWQ